MSNSVFIPNPVMDRMRASKSAIEYQHSDSARTLRFNTLTQDLATQ